MQGFMRMRLLNRFLRGKKWKFKCKMPSAEIVSIKSVLLSKQQSIDELEIYMYFFLFHGENGTIHEDSFGSTIA